eukprot:gene207-302_t
MAGKRRCPLSPPERSPRLEHFVRLSYHIDMLVSRQQIESTENERGPKVRMRKRMLEAAIGLMQQGITPSVTDVAEAAEVSRATAYRYFPSQAALVHAVVDEALGPILEWTSVQTDPRDRIKDLLATAMPRIEEFEATFKAALKMSLDQWAQRQAGTLGSEPQFTRGHRIDLLMQVTAPMEATLAPEARLRLAQSLSLVFGIEVLIVLKDIWGLSSAQAQSVSEWAGVALVETALREARHATAPLREASRVLAARPEAIGGAKARGLVPKRVNCLCIHGLEDAYAAKHANIAHLTPVIFGNTRLRSMRRDWRWIPGWERGRIPAVWPSREFIAPVVVP